MAVTAKPAGLPLADPYLVVGGGPADAEETERFAAPGNSAASIWLSSHGSVRPRTFSKRIRRTPS